MPPRATTARDHDPSARAREVGDELIAFEDLRPGGHAQLDALARGTVLPRAATGLAALRLEPAATLKARQVAEIRIGYENDISAGTSVAAVGPALRHVLLAPEAHRAVPAAPGLDPDARAIVEHSPTRSL